MQKTLIITILGQDRVGLVESIAAAINRLGGNWTDSRMAHLSGQFAGLLRLEIDASQIDTLNTELDGLRGDGLQITLQQADNDSATSRKPRHLVIELLGQDRPGIIRDITTVLARLNVNIEELTSEVREASMSGELLFAATLQLSVPTGVAAESVRESLESLSDQLMVDLNFDQ